MTCQCHQKIVSRQVGQREDIARNGVVHHKIISVDQMGALPPVHHRQRISCKGKETEKIELSLLLQATLKALFAGTVCLTTGVRAHFRVRIHANLPSFASHIKLTLESSSNGPATLPTRCKFLSRITTLVVGTACHHSKKKKRRFSRKK